MFSQRKHRDGSRLPEDRQSTKRTFTIARFTKMKVPVFRSSNVGLTAAIQLTATAIAIARQLA